MSQIDLRTAINNVRNYISEFNDILGNNLDNVLIEETELSEDKKFWLITIGFDRKIDPNTVVKTDTNNLLFSEEMTNLLPQRKTLTVERVYKTFKVDSATGEVISMKMYKL
ncbi:MAG: hypothetical protein QNJ34_12965 [Xenococcaceae cyanobacterium MO_188.B29]|nr:hypothetical protein [Xenococcaceae cyanobacterium MO_188.B29]